jgi:RNA 3'-terminal phosphate cyclase (ATP)
LTKLYDFTFLHQLAFISNEMKAAKPVVLDGATGEGGGQLVRLAVGLAALSGKHIRITNIRGKRGSGPKGGGLKAQHVASLRLLSQMTNATVDGMSIGSKTLDFAPQLPPTALSDRKLKVRADNAGASGPLIFQAILPFLLFAGQVAGENKSGDGQEPTPAAEDRTVEVTLEGGTNVSW